MTDPGMRKERRQERNSIFRSVWNIIFDDRLEHDVQFLLEAVKADSLLRAQATRSIERCHGQLRATFREAIRADAQAVEDEYSSLCAGEREDPPTAAANASTGQQEYYRRAKIERPPYQKTSTRSD